MRLFNHHFLRIFVAFLITVFISNTVYAGGMMVSASFDNNAIHTPVQPQAVLEHSEVRHCHDQISSGEHDSDEYLRAIDASISHQSHHQSPSHGGCSHCNHCMACYSMMLDDQVKVESISSQPVLAITTHVLYLAPTNPQPNKPPIS